MKKIVSFIFIIAMLLSVLCGCGKVEKPASNNYSNIYFGYEDYWFDQLSPRQQDLYKTLLEKIEEQQEYYVSCKEFSYDEITQVRVALEKEHPELNLYVFSEDDYDPVNDVDGNNVFGVNYSYRDMVHDYREFDFVAIQKDIDLINVMCDDIISKMPLNLSAYGKYEYLALELAGMADYCFSETDQDRSFIYLTGPFLYDLAICNSYSASYQYLCKRADLWCIFVYDAIMPHAYNMIKLETGLYYVDITWCDQGNMADFDYSYFAITQEQMEIDHTPEKSAPQGSNIPIS